MRAVDQKPEYHLEWPYSCALSSFGIMSWNHRSITQIHNSRTLVPHNVVHSPSINRSAVQRVNTELGYLF